MCFSASASFALSAVLLPAGGYCTRCALRRDRSLLPVAVAPILFGIQQIAEGLVWIGLHGDKPRLVTASSLVFLFFALCFWLFWTPFSVLILTRGRRVRWLLAAITLAGLAGGLVLYVPLLVHPGSVATRIVYHSVQYQFPLPNFFAALPSYVWQVLYLAIVAIPLLAVRSRGLLGFAILLIASAVIAQFVYRYAFTSVWCFFAAALSIYLCVFFGRLRPREEGGGGC